MGMMAVFACNQCNREIIRGCTKGNEMTPPDFACVICAKKTQHLFQRYMFVDERTDSQRMSERLQQ